MKTLDRLLEHGGNKKEGNFSVENLPDVTLFRHYGDVIAIVNRRQNQCVVYNHYGSQSTSRAAAYLEQALRNRGVAQIVWGNLKVYPRKGSFFQTVSYKEYPLHSAYPLQKHLTNPSQIVWATILKEDQEEKVVHISYDISHLTKHMVHHGWLSPRVNVSML